MKLIISVATHAILIKNPFNLKKINKKSPLKIKILL